VSTGIDWNTGANNDDTVVVEVHWTEDLWADPEAAPWRLKKVIGGIANRRGPVKLKCLSQSFLLELWRELSKKWHNHAYPCIAVFDPTSGYFVVSYARTAAYAKGNVLH